jgi:hypothetical protein
MEHAMNESSAAEPPNPAKDSGKNEHVAYPVLASSSEAHPIAKVIEDYLAAIRDIAQTVNIVMPHLAKWQIDEIKKHEKRLSHFIPEGAEEGQKHRITLESARDFAELTATLRTLEELHTSRALSVLARSLFMQMFSEFDSFTGCLLKAIYLKNQELLKGIAREITLRELFDYQNVDDIKRSMLEKEIETFRRDSYVDQFIALEKKFQIQLRKFDEYPEFIEFSQRRNIFVHNDGMVSDQYISVCEREGWKFSRRPATGETLHVDIEYFGRALRVMSKVGFMLAHTLWAKVFPKENEQLHNSINDLIYQCLEHKRWRTAAELGSFALSEPMRKGVTEINLRIRTINVAIGLKFSDRDEEAKSLLRSADWTASYRDFKLAIHVLEENYEDAVDIMLSIGKSGEILKQSSYYTWPLFHNFRVRPEFYATYEKIYGEPYATQIPTDGKTTSVSVSKDTVTSLGPNGVSKNSRKRPPSAESSGLVSRTLRPKKRSTTKPPRGAASQETPPK